MMRGWWLAMGCVAACGDDAGPAGEQPGPACALVGERVTVPYSTNFDVAEVADGWVIVSAGTDGVGAFHLGQDGALGAREAVSLPANASLGATSMDGVVYVTSPAQATFDGLRIAKRVDGTWTTEREPDVVGNTTFDYGSAIAAANGKVAVVWISGTAAGGVTLHVTDFVDGTFTTRQVPAGGIPSVVGNEVEATFVGDTLWIVVGGDDSLELGLYAYSRDASGTWSRAIDLGPIEGSAQNISLAGMATDDSGRPRLVVVEPASFIDDAPGGARVVSVDDQKAGSGPSDDRPVTEGVDVAPMPGFGVLATASWGGNNLDISQSRDALVLYSCIGSCRQVLALDAVNGTFYGRAKIATSGQSGVVVYNREPKGPSGEDTLVAQRFSCTTPTP